MKESGYDKLWGWFGLSYASWLTLPRCVMHAMPDEWQARMAQLLNELDDAFDYGEEGFETSVSAKRNGKFIRMPSWCSRSFYRHPDEKVINSLRRTK